jgi:hypothetical protein
MKPPWSLTRFRDLTLLAGESEVLVIACDSLGGIGPHPGDLVRVEPEIVGYGLARVVLLELASVRAEPLLVVDALCCAAQPHGAAIAAGVARHLVEIGLDPAGALTGSTEENMPVETTGAGIFALGRAPAARLLVEGGRAGDLMLLVGRPKVGAAVRFEDPELPTHADFTALADLDGVHELIPLGSGGIGAELEALERRQGLHFRPLAPAPVPLDRSGGPATAALLVTAPDPAAAGAAESLLDRWRARRPARDRLPLFLLGRIEPRP